METILADDAANVYIQDMASEVALRKSYSGFEFYPLYVLDMAKSQSKIKPGKRKSCTGNPYTEKEKDRMKYIVKKKRELSL